MARRVGIVGAGRIAGVHRRHLAALGASEIRVYDRDLARAEAFGAPVAGSLESLIQGSDLVVVCAPNAAHREIAEAALGAGKAVFLEKPISLTLEDADVLVAREEAGGFIAVGHVVRFFPAYALAHEQVAKGAIGRVAVARMLRAGGFPGNDGRAWYADHSRSGGVIVDLGIHDLDWLLWTLGPATRVTARSLGAAKGEGPDHAVATIDFASGAMAHVESSWIEPAPFRTAFDVAGSEGLLEFDSTTEGNVGTNLLLGPKDDPYARQWAAILAALDGGTPPPVTAREAREALRLALAARESAVRGERISLR